MQNMKRLTVWEGSGCSNEFLAGTISPLRQRISGRHKGVRLFHPRIHNLRVRVQSSAMSQQRRRVTFAPDSIDAIEITPQHLLYHLR